MKACILSFIEDEDGQDLVEYALLTVFVALTGALAFNLLSSSIGSAYAGWDAAEQNLRCPPDPSSSTSTVCPP